jgi:competence ComEA-like helix-hairpin-helix protein
MYLNILVELGLVGLILFAVLIVGAFIAAMRAVRAFAREGDWNEEILARGLVVGTIGMLAAFVFLSAQYEKQLPLLLGLLLALSSLVRMPEDVRGAASRRDFDVRAVPAIRGSAWISDLPSARSSSIQSPGSSARPPTRLRLSTATVDQLEALPGIGPVTAQRIIAYRTTHGPFRVVSELEAIRGLGPARVAHLRDLVAP